jgi:addiction module RelE/StbE family toxin
MIIQTTKSFDRQYKKLSLKTKLQFKKRIGVFALNPFDVSLRNHALKGKYIGYRSIDITGDIRVLYKIKDDKIIILGFIGSHSELY